MSDQFDQIASGAWEEAKTPLEKMYDTWTGGEWEPGPGAPTYRLFDVAGRPIPCRICGRDDRWFVDGNDSARVFVCEHEPIMASRITLRNIVTIRPEQVSRYEQTGGPREE